MACVCMCVSVYVRECVRTSVQQERETGTWPKIPSLPPCPTPPHPCRRRCAANGQWGRRAVPLQAGPPPASLQAEPSGTDGLIQRTQSPAFWYPGKAVFNVPHLAGCVIYSHLYAERSRPKSLLHFHSFNRPQAQPHVNTHTCTPTHTGHTGTHSQTYTDAVSPLLCGRGPCRWTRVSGCHPSLLQLRVWGHPARSSSVHAKCTQPLGASAAHALAP